MEGAFWEGSSVEDGPYGGRGVGGEEPGFEGGVAQMVEREACAVR